MLIESQNFLGTNEEQGGAADHDPTVLSVFGGVEINDEGTLETSTEPRLVDLSGPLKIHDLGEPVRSIGEERDRTMAAYTPIGTFTLATFIPNQKFNNLSQQNGQT